jgi:hypothetical protein
MVVSMKFIAYSINIPADEFQIPFNVYIVVGLFPEETCFLLYISIIIYKSSLFLCQKHVRGCIDVTPNNTVKDWELGPAFVS